MTHFVSKGAAPPQYYLWFGTHRRPFDPKTLAHGFTNERDQTMHFGRCRVVIPNSHKIATTQPSWWERLWNDLIKVPNERIRLVGLKTLADRITFLEDLRVALAERQSTERQVLVYLHGFNVSFEEAAICAAQIGCDLQFPGVTAFYSWPSRGHLAAYTYDEATIDASEKYIRDFLLLLLSLEGVERLHVIAHSMGNRALLRITREITHTLGRKPFGQVVLAAPDVDANVFADLAGAYAEAAERTTLYVSSRDRALFASSRLHDYSRAGYTPPVAVVDGIDTIDVAGVDLTVLGHGYYAEVRACMADIHGVLTQPSVSPGDRFGVRAEESDGGRYWRLAP